jgi:hypothetical protein
MFERYSQKLTARSSALLLALDNRLDRILQTWLLVAGFASALRIVASSHQVAPNPSSAFASYLLLVVAPFASTLLALRWFGDGQRQPQPSTRLARLGKWRPLDRHEAEKHPLYGTSGIMVSLLVGMMLNVPVRAIEYLVAIPPLPDSAPRWFTTLHFAMTFDAVLFGCLYMIAFVAALRRVPLFPRLLVAIWLSDLAMQLFTASLVGGSIGLPADVASALHSMLEGNIKKTLISMALWLPYLLLSTRVNVTYRHRVPA